MFEIIWTWVVAHAPDIAKFITGVKLFADTADSVKKLAPAKLEMSNATQTYATETLAIAEDQTKDLEERRLELDARCNLTESMVNLTKVEATYNIARYAIFTAFTAWTLHLIIRIIMAPGRPKPTSQQ